MAYRAVQSCSHGAATEDRKCAKTQASRVSNISKGLGACGCRNRTVRLGAADPRYCTPCKKCRALLRTLAGTPDERAISRAMHPTVSSPFTFTGSLLVW